MYCMCMCLYTQTNECGYIHECVFVDVYFVETEKLEVLYIKLLGLFISGILSCLTLYKKLIKANNNQPPCPLACSWAGRQPKYLEEI